MTAVELLPPGTGPDDERWHELRRQGITASEIAAVMGISPWQSPFSLYWQKANDWRSDGNEFTSAGRHLEDAIADWWMATQDPLENMVAARAGLYAHPDRPWQVATPDRLLFMVCPECDGNPAQFMLGRCPQCYDTGARQPLLMLLECKWVAYSWDGWGEPGTDDIPVYYRAQCLWQADVLGVDEVHVAALGPGGFRAYVVRRDEDDLAVMRAAGEAFHKRLAAGDPPDLDSHSATLGALKRLYPSVGEGDVEVSRSMSAEYALLRTQRKATDEALALVEAQIREALGDTYARAVTATGQTVASRSVFTQDRIDSKRLRAEQPDIAAAYTSTTTVDKLTPGRPKKDA